MHMTRLTVRHVAAAMSATMALIYVLIGIGVLYPEAACLVWLAWHASERQVAARR